MIGFDYFFYFPTPESKAKQRLAETKTRVGPHFSQCYWCKALVDSGKLYGHLQRCNQFQAHKEAQQND